MLVEHATDIFGDDWVLDHKDIKKNLALELKQVCGKHGDYPADVLDKALQFSPEQIAIKSNDISDYYETRFV